MHVEAILWRAQGFLVLTRDDETRYFIVPGAVLEEVEGEFTGRSASSGVFEDVLTAMEAEELLDQDVLQIIKFWPSEGRPPR